MEMSKRLARSLVVGGIGIAVVGVAILFGIGWALLVAGASAAATGFLFERVEPRPRRVRP